MCFLLSEPFDQVVIKGEENTWAFSGDNRIDKNGFYGLTLKDIAYDSYNDLKITIDIDAYCTITYYKQNQVVHTVNNLNSIRIWDGMPGMNDLYRYINNNPMLLFSHPKYKEAMPQ